MHGKAPVHVKLFSPSKFMTEPPSPLLPFVAIFLNDLLLVSRFQTKAFSQAVLYSQYTCNFELSHQTFLRPKDSFVYFGCAVGPQLGFDWDQVFQLSKVACRASRAGWCKQMYSLGPFAVLGCKHNFKIASTLSFLENLKLYKYLI